MKINHTELRSFFYGTLLGDSYIYNNTFQCKQISKDLIEFKKKIIEDNIPNSYPNITEFPAYIDKNGVNHQKYYQLSTSRHKYFSDLKELFYPNGKKILPKNIISKLTPLGYAMWYADDGTTILVQRSPNGSAKSRRIQICTDGFSKEEHEIISEELSNKGFTPKIVDRHRNNQVRIQLNNIRKTQLFFIEIGYYFYKYFPSLLYKMDLGYREDSLLKRAYVCEEYHNFYIEISAHPLFKDRMRDDIV